jgi:hypothetical protein
MSENLRKTEQVLNFHLREQKPGQPDGLGVYIDTRVNADTTNIIEAFAA